jgi:hypothetical protein
MEAGAMTLGYENPVHQYRVGDVVRIGSGKVEWTIVGKGATTGLSVKNETGRTRSTSTHEVTLIRPVEG